MIKHTPGPWTWDEKESTTGGIMSPSGPVCVFWAEYPDDAGIEWTAADKALILAAPELLEALKAVNEYGGGRNIMDQPLCPICGEPEGHEDGCPFLGIQAAIAKAEGK